MWRCCRRCCRRWRPQRREVVDGAVIGLAMAALVLLKVTYFVALRAAGGGGAADPARPGAALAAAVVGRAGGGGCWRRVWGGIGFWRGYVGDLLAVAHSPPARLAGADLGNICWARRRSSGINLVLLFGVILLRQSGRGRAGLLLLLLLPAFVYITYQNFGNDPQWLMLLVALLLTLLPPDGDAGNGWGWALRGAIDLAAVAALAFALPSFLNLAYSPWRHLWLDAADYVPLHAGQSRPMPIWPAEDALCPARRQCGAGRRRAGLEQLSPLRRARRRRSMTLNGEELPDCELRERAWRPGIATIAADLEAAGYAGRRIYEADLFNVLWLYGDFPRLQGAAPWYYGGAPGIADADLVLVPDVPDRTRRRAQAEAGRR